MHLPQVQIYADIDTLLKGDVIVIFVAAISIVNIMPLLSSVYVSSISVLSGGTWPRKVAHRTRDAGRACSSIH